MFRSPAAAAGFAGVITALVVFGTLTAARLAAGEAWPDAWSPAGRVLLALGAGAAVGLATGYAFHRWVHRPMRDVVRAIGRMSGAEDEVQVLRMTEDWTDYIRRQARIWNSMQSNEISNLRENEHFRKEFIGNLAHELKTPLHNIQGFILTLIEGAYEDPEISHKFLTKAAKNVERMTGLIEDLDAISRIESGILGLRIQEFDAIELARDTIESLEPKAKRAEITLSLHPDTPRSLVVLGDSTTIGQVLTNLVVNSITYGRPHGSTTLRIIARDEYAVFEVSDTGIGISEEDLPRIFERFYRVDKSRSRQAGGSGLGLAIVKHLIEAHGQHIHVKSTVGEGTAFTFRLRRPG